MKVNLLRRFLMNLGLNGCDSLKNLIALLLDFRLRLLRSMIFKSSFKLRWDFFSPFPLTITRVAESPPLRTFFT